MRRPRPLNVFQLLPRKRILELIPPVLVSALEVLHRLVIKSFMLGFDTCLTSAASSAGTYGGRSNGKARIIHEDMAMVVMYTLSGFSVVVEVVEVAVAACFCSFFFFFSRIANMSQFLMYDAASVTKSPIGLVFR